MSRPLRWARALAIAGGVLLFVIGLRFLLVPDQAVRTFGLARDAAATDFSAIIGLRDLWLGALAVALAWLRHWQALALWFGLGAFVCFADAGIAWTSSARLGPVAFHVVCGIFCVGLAILFHRSSGLISQKDQP